MLKRILLTELVLGPGQGPLPPGPLRRKTKMIIFTKQGGGTSTDVWNVSLTCSFLASDLPWSWEEASFLRNSGKRDVKGW